MACERDKWTNHAKDVTVGRSVPHTYPHSICALFRTLAHKVSVSFAMSEGNVFMQMVLLQWTREKPVVQPSKEVTAIEGSHGYGRNV